MCQNLSFRYNPSVDLNKSKRAEERYKDVHKVLQGSGSRESVQGAKGQVKLVTKHKWN